MPLNDIRRIKNPIR